MRSVKPYIISQGALGDAQITEQKGKATLISSSEVLSKTGSGISNRNVKNIERERALRRSQLILAARKFGWFELIWYPVFIIGGLLCLLFIPFSFELAFSVVNLFTYMLANNLVARGKRVGLLISTISMVVYSVVSFMNQVWGEVIINLCMYIPLEIVGFVRWKKDNEKESQQMDIVKKCTPLGLLGLGGALALLTGAIFAVLHFGLKQNYAIFNAIGIAACILGGQARNHKYIETWLLYIIANLGSIALWCCTAFIGDGTGMSLAVLPIILSYSSTLTNDFNGWVIWEIFYKKCNKKEGVYLAKRKVKLSNISKMKHTYNKFTCRETSDVAGERFRQR